MAYEYSTTGGTLRLVNNGDHWAIEFNGCRRGRWRSVDDAATAVCRHCTGLPTWDRSPLIASDDVLRWRPFGDNL